MKTITINSQSEFEALKNEQGNVEVEANLLIKCNIDTFGGYIDTGGGYIHTGDIDTGGGFMVMVSRWHISISDNKIKIGCHAKTVAEWDDWFAGSQEYDTPRDSSDFVRIRAHYEAAKSYMKVLKDATK